MTLSGTVNNLYWELDLLNKKVCEANLYNPRYQTAINQLKFRVHQLYSEALYVDNLARNSRVQPYMQIREIQRQNYLLQNEVRFISEQFVTFTQWDIRSPPRNTEIFSSPSHSPTSPSPENMPIQSSIQCTPEFRWSGSCSGTSSLLSQESRGSNQQGSQRFNTDGGALSGTLPQTMRQKQRVLSRARRF